MKTRYTSQIARKLQRNAILLIIIASSLSASPGSRAAELCNCDTQWTGAVDNNWFNPSNWSSDFIPSCGGTSCPPLGGAAQGEINTGTPQISGQSQTAYACALTLGVSSGQTGNLSVDDGTLDMCGEIFVGSNGAGKLSITNGGIVSTDVGGEIASFNGSNGSVTVDGENQGGTKSQWTVTNGEIDVGGTNSSAGGTGLLSVTNGGTASAATLVHVYKSGTLTGNSSVNVNSGSGTATVEGTLSPNWTLTINGDLTFSSTASTSPTMQCNVTPDNLNSVDAEVTKTATLTGRVSVTMTGTFTPGTTYTLLNADVGVSGTFTMESINFPPGQNFTPKIEYDTHHVKLYLQPNT